MRKKSFILILTAILMFSNIGASFAATETSKDTYISDAEIEKTAAKIEEQLDKIGYYFSGEQRPGFYGVINYYNFAKQNYMQSAGDVYMKMWFNNLLEELEYLQKLIGPFSNLMVSDQATDAQKEYVRNVVDSAYRQRQAHYQEFYSLLEKYGYVFFDKPTEDFYDVFNKAGITQSLLYSIKDGPVSFENFVKTHINGLGKSAALKPITREYFRQLFYGNRELDQYELKFLDSVSETVTSLVLRDGVSTNATFW